MAKPIWLDTFVTLGTTDGIAYTIHDGLTSAAPTIYSGVGYLRPGESSVKIRINDICKDYMHQSIDSGIVGIPFVKWFSVYAGSTRKALVQFYLAKDYCNAGVDYLSDKTLVHAPITGRAVPGQRIWLTNLFEYENDVCYGYTDDTPTETQLVGGGSPQNFAVEAEVGSGTFAIYMEDYPYYKVQYEVRPRCGQKYYLEYVNAMGGIDSLLIDGLSRQTDDYTRQTITKEYDNGNGGRGKDNYCNDIQRRWSLHTGWLTQEQSDRMHHLLGSTLVQMTDLDSNITMPVVITNASCPYKIVRDGMIDYELLVELAQGMER